MSTIDVAQTVSNLVEKQFPSFYNEDGENFVAFVKAYYEWMEQSGYTINKSRQLFEIRDIDSTPAAFVDHFKKKYFANLPRSIEGDVKFLQKHILDLYRAKGSAEGVKLLFRLLFNEEIDIYIPANDVLKASDGIWVEPKYFEISNRFNNYLYEGTYVTGATSGATAFVENYKRIYIDDHQAQVLYVTNISGEFEVGEQLVSDVVNINDAAFILGSPSNISVNFASPDQPVGEIVNSVYTFGATNFDGIVIGSYDVTDGFINFIINSGGSRYSHNANISITTGSNTMGYSATFTDFVLANTEDITYNLDVINYIPHDKTIYFNANADVVNAYDFIEFANNVTANSRSFANGDMVKYICAPGNTAISGLSNNSYYYVAGANSSGIQLTSSYTIKTFNANSAVNNSTEFITIATNTFANGDLLRYVTAAGNTALTNLANNSYYYAIQANSTGLKLATTYTPKIFNPKLAIANTVDDYYISLPSHTFANDDIVRYTTSIGNTSIAALANNTYYYVVQANSGGIKLSTSLGGAAILLYSLTLPSEDGHNIYGAGTPINLTKGLTESGHSLWGYSPIAIANGANQFGHALVGRGVQFNANSDVTDASDFISIANNAFANGDQVTYHVITGNTAVSGLTNNTIYWVVSANDVGLKLSSTYGGANIDITKGATETGHFLTGVSKVDMLINTASFGASLLNANSTSVLDTVLTDDIQTVGTIIRLTGLNPGRNYDGDVVVRVRDNYTASYGIYDANGAIEGENSVILGKAVRGNDIPNQIKVRDSGFGHNTEGENITLTNVANASAFIDGNIILGALGVEPGFWLNNQGKLSSDKYIHDNLYYQEYSYEIQFKKSLDKYVDILDQVIHPVGNKIFGKPVLLHFDSVPLVVVDSSITQA
ncbi:hypothetical protein UFOVP247_103 [uncultured Caudovirales phage]|uniref:Baseplate wedge subunit n=1 Tax=uncultured Caudovirales phage TaxID=2100421 RepID=A0A6J7WSY4_9CAUD|nr:hypothetical protein UFOVP247_103 [uncultured Caudovirales phage]